MTGFSRPVLLLSQKPSIPGMVLLVGEGDDAVGVCSRMRVG
jgi:hypothetical protein